MTGTPWAATAPSRKYGGAMLTAPTADPAGGHLAAVAGPGVADAGHPLLSPSNPLMWFGVLAAVTVGLMSYSTSVKVGPVKAALDVGK